MVFEEQLFTESECQLIISLSEPILTSNSNDSYDANTGRITYFNESFKKSYNVSIVNNNGKSSWVFERLLGWFSRKMDVQLKNGMTLNGGLVHTYNIGDCFEKHVDINDEFIDRRYNIGIQLNNDYEGGDYNYWLNNTVYSFSKHPGTAILYPIDTLHEVTEIKSGTRISFVTHIGKGLIKNKGLL
jgi:PKHD-type hydroxylase